MDVNGKNQRRLTNSTDNKPAWSPDGRQTDFSRQVREKVDKDSLLLQCEWVVQDSRYEC